MGGCSSAGAANADRLAVSALVVMAWAHGQVELLRERSSTERKKWRDAAICTHEGHQASWEAAEYPHPIKASCDGQLVGGTPMPGCVHPIKELETPGVSASAQPAGFRPALSRDAGIGKAQLPVGLPSHLYLPVVSAVTEAAEAEDVECGVEARGIFCHFLPGVRVGGRSAVW